MQNGGKKKRRRSLFPWMLALAFGIIAGVAVFIYISYQKAASELVIERDRQLAYLSAARLKDEITKFSDILQALSRTSDISNGDLLQQRTALKSAQFNLDIFDGGVVLLNNLGRVVATQPERARTIGQDWSDRDYFNQLLVSQTVYFSDMVYDGIDGKNAIVVSVPLFGEKAEFTGVLAGMFTLNTSNTSAFFASIVRLRIGQSGNTYLVDGKGNMLYNSGAIGFTSNQNTNNLDWLPDETDGNAMRTRDAAGHDIVAAYAPVPGTNWRLITEDDWKIVTSETRRYTSILFGLLAVGMLLPAIGVGVFLRRQSAETLKRELEEQDLMLANRIEEMILPGEAPYLSGWDLSMQYLSTNIPGGDFFDFMFLPDGRLMIMVGTVNDLGVLATYAMTTVRTALRGAALSQLTPAEAVGRSNRLVFPEIRPGITINCLYGVLVPDSGIFTYVNAGLSSPCIVSNRRVDSKDITEDPLGKSLESTYSTQSIHIHPEDCLLLYTDGWIELIKENGRDFSCEDTYQVWQASHKGEEPFLQALLSGYSQDGKLIAGCKQDITLLSVARQPVEPSKILKDELVSGWEI
jgi:serine phosphatase RsbU (regulator of sigma subunit)